MYIYVCRSCFDKYISVALGPPKQQFLAPPLSVSDTCTLRLYVYDMSIIMIYVVVVVVGGDEIGTSD